MANKEKIISGDQDEKSMQPTYDKEKHEVDGPGFKIKWVGESAREEIFAKFYYKDGDIDFYFLAERLKWIDAPASPAKRKLIDTKEYAVERMWCVDESCVDRKLSISAHLKERAKNNVLSGLMLMEEPPWPLPIRVIIRKE